MRPISTGVSSVHLERKAPDLDKVSHNFSAPDLVVHTGAGFPKEFDAQYYTKSIGHEEFRGVETQLF